MLRREFKIHGVVAGDNFKDGLSFVSLARQIESGIKAGYKESEIVEAVIRAISPRLIYTEVVLGDDTGSVIVSFKADNESSF